VERKLSPIERDLLLRLLVRAKFAGAQELLNQTAFAVVTGGIATFLELDVPRTSPPAKMRDGPALVRAFVEAADGELEGEIIIWVKGGYLSGLEYAWYSDVAPSEMPSPDRVRVK
jgi:hypothetical protein